MKNLEPREGFKNRNVDGLPDRSCIMSVITNDIEGEHIWLCKFLPFDPLRYDKGNMPGKGYLGTAEVIDGAYAGIGYHAWEQNDYEFIYYKPENFEI